MGETDSSLLGFANNPSLWQTEIPEEEGSNLIHPEIGDSVTRKENKFVRGNPGHSKVAEHH